MISQKANTLFWDKIAEKYSKTPIVDEASYQQKLKLTQEHFSKQSTVFEFGCGTGTTAIHHAPHVKHIDAIDISENMLDIARQKAKDSNVQNINFQKASIADFNIKNNSYDVVLAMSILQLLEDKELAIEKSYEMLKPGGVFISSTACIREKIPFFNFFAPLAQLLRLIPLVSSFSTKQLKNSMIQANFNIEYEWQPNNSMVTFIIARKPG